MEYFKLCALIIAFMTTKRLKIVYSKKSNNLLGLRMIVNQIKH